MSTNQLKSYFQQNESLSADFSEEEHGEYCGGMDPFRN
jgi:hypothetical protein